MGKTHERIEGRLRSFIEAQPVFFTATAPLSADGTVNLSPKGLKGSSVVLDEHTVAYLDFAGSNAETIAHLRENGRITRASLSSATTRASRNSSPASRTSTRRGTACARSSS
ncbi:hypothetical protein SPURM210S_01468 [Streptomyces purpurascens]|nr:hypothetical protein GCM10010303_54150 [Streptomyces purpurascens]